MLKFKTVEEVGFVKSVEGIFATVSVPKKSACEGCSLGICKPEEQTMEIEALNNVKARVGQKVRVAMKTYSYLKSAIIVYGIPALALISGAVLGKEVFSRYLEDIDSDIVSAVFGFGAFVLSFLLVKFWSSRVVKKVELKPIIEEILE
jgi:sigma-E factor negative regulatory protein RseC